MNPGKALSTGYTLVELVTVLAIVGILAASTSSLGSWVQTSRLTSYVNALVGDLALARSEAIKRGHQVLVCKSLTGTECSDTADWHQGWIVFADRNENEKRDGDEPILRVQAKLAGAHLVLHAFGGTDRYVVYRPTGSSYTNATFTYCPEAGRDARLVVLAQTGRARTARENAQKLEACRS